MSGTRTWVALCLIAASACGGKSDVEKRYTAAAAAQRKASGAPADELTAIRKNGEAMEVTYFEGGERHTLAGTNEEPTVRRYRIDGGSALFDASGWPDHFSLTVPQTKERCRVVRLYVPGEISVGENDNDGDALRILDGERDRATIVDGGGQQIGAVTYDGTNTVVSTAANAVRFKTPTPKLEPAYGVLLMDRIPVHERYVVIAELMARGR